MFVRLKFYVGSGLLVAIVSFVFIFQRTYMTFYNEYDNSHAKDNINNKYHNKYHNVNIIGDYLKDDKVEFQKRTIGDNYSDNKYNGSEQWNFRFPDKSLLKIYFYVHDVPELKPFRECTMLGNPKISSEYYFLKAIKTHPWRVLDPDLAELFVVPIPYALTKYKLCGSATEKDVEVAAEAIRRTPQFQRNNGWDHFIFGTLFSYLHEKHLDSISANMTLGHKGYFFNEKRYRCMVAVPFGTYYDTGFITETYNSWERRLYNLFFQGQADKRAAYTIRRIAMESLIGYMSPNVLVVTSPEAPFPDCETNNDTLYIPLSDDNPHLGIYEGCKEVFSKTFFQRLRDSKFNLYFRGDDFGSKRLVDSFLTHTPVIVFSDEWWYRGQPFGCHLPWDNMVIRGSETNFMRDPVKEMDRILKGKASPERIVEILELMEEYRDAVLWTSPNSYATTLTIFEAARTCIVGNEESPAKQFQCPYNHGTYTG